MREKTEAQTWRNQEESREEDENWDLVKTTVDGGYNFEQSRHMLS